MNQSFYKEVGKIKVLPDNEILDMIQKYKAGDESQLTKLIESNLKLIVFFAKKYHNHIKNSELIEEDDLIAECSFEIKSAVKNFKPELNIKFSYYLSIWVKKYLTEYIINTINTIKLPIDKVKRNERLKKQIQSIIQDTQEEIEVYQLEELNIPQHIIDFYFDSKISFISEYECENVPDDNDIDDELIEKLTFEMDKLNEREKMVLTLYFGINLPKPIKTGQIAELLKLTRQTVMLCKRNALKKLNLKMK